jgi:hypothetical protein
LLDFFADIESYLSGSPCKGMSVATMTALLFHHLGSEVCRAVASSSVPVVFSCSWLSFFFPLSVVGSFADRFFGACWFVGCY